MLMQDAAELRRLVRSNDNQLRTFLTKISDSAQRFRQGKRKETLAITYGIYSYDRIPTELECGPMPNLMVALPNIGGALCSTPQSLADAHY